MRQFLIMTVQATAILSLTWLMHVENPNEPLLGFFFINFVLVAFLTGVAVHLFDRLRLRRSAVAHVDQPQRNGVCPPALSSTSRQLGEKRSRSRIS